MIVWQCTWLIYRPYWVILHLWIWFACSCSMHPSPQYMGSGPIWLSPIGINIRDIYLIMQLGCTVAHPRIEPVYVRPIPLQGFDTVTSIEGRDHFALSRLLGPAHAHTCCADAGSYFQVPHSVEYPATVLGCRSFLIITSTNPGVEWCSGQLPH